MGFFQSGLSLFGKRTRKPNSVLCGHSSRRRVAADAHQRPTRRFRPRAGAAWAHRAGAQRPHGSLEWRFPPYLVLLRVGFTLPPALLTERCALTAPFHPYPGAGTWPVRNRRARGCPTSGLAEAVCSLWHWPSTGLNARVPDVIRHTALRSSDFPPPASPARAVKVRQRPPGPPAISYSSAIPYL